MLDQKRVVIALTTHDFAQSGLLRGLQAYLLTQPHLHARFCLLLNPDSGADVRLLRKTIARFRPDGVLAHVFWKRADLRLDAHVPLVNLSDVQVPAYPTVMVDQRQAGRMVAEHLLEQGLVHLAFIALPGREYFARLRWRGFRERVVAAGHPCRRFVRVSRAVDDESVSDEDVCAWLAQLPKPVGIHAVTLDVALRVLWGCQELGLKVPEDVALVGGRDLAAIATAWDPPLSALSLDFARVGCESMRLLDRLMRGEPAPAAPLLLPPSGIVARQSSDVRGMRDQEVARIRRLIREQAHQPLAVKEVLPHTALSRSALERRFEKHLGHSLHDEIVQARMERAQRLLRETLLPVTQVAAQSGYANYAVFSVAFRRHTGVRALDYRRRIAAVAEA